MGRDCGGSRTEAHWTAWQGRLQPVVSRGAIDGRAAVVSREPCCRYAACKDRQAKAMSDHVRLPRLATRHLHPAMRLSATHMTAFSATHVPALSATHVTALSATHVPADFRVEQGQTRSMPRTGYTGYRLQRPAAFRWD